MQSELALTGSCFHLQFGALSDQLYRSPRFHRELRQAAVEHLQQNPDMYAPYMEGSFEEYCKSMARDGMWGEHITLQVGGPLETIASEELLSIQRWEIDLS